MKFKLVLVLCSLLFLTACGTAKPTPMPTITPTPIATKAAFEVPNDCLKTTILKSFPSDIKNPKFVDTNWTPAAGTDLAAVYSAGGIACTYGIQSAEIGTTIMWAPNTNNIFNIRKAIWAKNNQVKVDLPGVLEDEAYVITDAARTAGEFHSWYTNLLIDGIWIQVGASYVQSVEQGMPLVKAAIAAIRSAAAAQKTKIVGCYVATLKQDKYMLNVTSQENNLITANIAFRNANKDSSSGTFKGFYTNEILTGIYDFKSEGMHSKRELFYKGGKTGFNPGFGPVVSQGNNEKMQRPLNLAWDLKYEYLPSTTCTTL
jgi:hypothetical protein